MNCLEFAVVNKCMDIYVLIEEFIKKINNNNKE